MFQEADKAAIAAYQQGKIDGAVEAAVPLLIDIAGLEAWQDEAEKKLASNFWGSFLKTSLFVAGSLFAGFVVGSIVN